MSLRALLLAVLLLAACAPREAPFVALDYADLGTTRVLDGGHAGLVLLVADDVSMAKAETLARAFAARGGSAALVDSDVLLGHLRDSHAACIDLGTLLDVYAQQVQQTLRFERFGRASLIGIGQGAALVPMVLAQTRGGVFAAGVSAGTKPALGLPAPPCGDLASKLHWQSPDQAIAIPDDVALATPWRASADDSADSVLAALDGVLATHESGPGAMPDLPLIELPQPGGGSAPWIAVVLSGDGGWANIDKDIAEELGTRGIAVLGWNSLRYFWQRKTPEQAGTDLATLVRWVTRAWGKPRVLLIGYSLGAEVLPFMVSRAPADVHEAIAGMVLLNPEQSVDFQFHIGDWLGSGDPDPYPLAPEMAKISGVPVLCVYGADDEPGLCPLLTGRADASVRTLPGDHHYDGDYAAVTRLILERFPATIP